MYPVLVFSGTVSNSIFPADVLGRIRGTELDKAKRAEVVKQLAELRAKSAPNSPAYPHRRVQTLTPTCGGVAV